LLLIYHIKLYGYSILNIIAYSTPFTIIEKVDAVKIRQIEVERNMKVVGEKIDALKSKTPEERRNMNSAEKRIYTEELSKANSELKSLKADLRTNATELKEMVKNMKSLSPDQVVALKARINEHNAQAATTNGANENLVAIATTEANTMSFRGKVVTGVTVVTGLAV
jgi:chromosome segregation ATPase